MATRRLLPYARVSTSCSCIVQGERVEVDLEVQHRLRLLGVSNASSDRVILCLTEPDCHDGDLLSTPLFTL